eukprot:1900297-Rhodomonas_salina.2
MPDSSTTQVMLQAGGLASEDLGCLAAGADASCGSGQAVLVPGVGDGARQGGGRRAPLQGQVPPAPPALAPLCSSC